MKAKLCVLGFIILAGILAAAPQSLITAEYVARLQLSRLDTETELEYARTIMRAEQALAYVFQLQPQGYIVVSADDELPPVLAYSLTSSFGAEDSDLLADLLREDISLRLQQMTDSQRALNRQQWHNLGSPRDPFQQWPPEGSTLTGGWIKTQWTQNAPYNNFCPLDPVTGIRSLAGCPAVAMAQIVNYHKTINGTVFSDADDYHHSYANRNYWIDNDALARDFPTWAQLNGYLATMLTHYKYHQDQTPEDMAALTWACGAAADQVYTSEGSGTFAVSQIYSAFQRFGFQEMDLLTDTDPQLYNRMAQNMMDALPVHLAVVTPDWNSGHNVVVDGYNTDGFFHLNFGWGGSYSGWYLLPAEIPYNLTVIEGAVVDIQPRQYLFSLPDTLRFTTYESVHNPQTLEIINISDAPLVIEAVHPIPEFLGEGWLQIDTAPVTLPYTLPAGQSLNLALEWDWIVDLPREIIKGCIEIVHSYGIQSVPMILDTSLFYTEVEDEIQGPPARISAYPNPFRSDLTLKSGSGGKISAAVFNLKGQCIRRLQCGIELSWDGLDSSGRPVPNGLYLIKVEQDKRCQWLKVIRLR